MVLVESCEVDLCGFQEIGGLLFWWKREAGLWCHWALLLWKTQPRSTGTWNNLYAPSNNSNLKHKKSGRNWRKSCECVEHIWMIIFYCQKVYVILLICGTVWYDCSYFTWASLVDAILPWHILRCSIFLVSTFPHFTGVHQYDESILCNSSFDGLCPCPWSFRSSCFIEFA